MVAGDLNAKFVLWSCLGTDADECSEKLEAMAAALDFQFINTSTKRTFVKRRQQSIIDVRMASQ